MNALQRALSPTGWLFKTISVIFLYFAWFVLTFYLSYFALFEWALWYYPHPGSMTGFWAFMTSIPIAVAFAIPLTWICARSIFRRLSRPSAGLLK
jgi:hypothetical protein